METFNYFIKKFNINLDNRYVIDIPNVGRDQMGELFKELGFKKGVEVGVEKGIYSEVLLKANPDLELYCVDPWIVEAYESGIHAVDSEQEKFDGRYEECKARLSPYKNAKMIRKMSMDAVNDFEDESLDFVYIDANHDFPNFINDLHQWKKKVKMGGVVYGHDYAVFSYKKHNHVKRALDAYARCYRMIPFFVLGSMEMNPGEIRDKYRSWLWIKDK